MRSIRIDVYKRQVPDRTTSVIACIRIDSRFYAETVYVVGNRFHSVRETFLVGEHDSVVVTFAEEAIVYVDIVAVSYTHLKADASTPYSVMKNVMNSLQDLRENRYNLITSLTVEYED